MKKCEVLAERVSLTVGKGSIVFVEDRQYELAKAFLKPIEAKKEEPKEIEEPKEETKTKKKKK